MLQENEYKTFNASFCRKTKELRQRTGMSAASMASLLGIPMERYVKYENRSPIPHYLIRRFIAITDSSFDEMFGYKKIQHKSFERHNSA